MNRVRQLAFSILFFVVAPVCVPSAYADVLNQSQSFRVNSFYDSAGATSLQATLRAVGTKSYFFVDDRYWNFLTTQQQNDYMIALQTLQHEFDSVIYPVSVGAWGSEATPGVDGDPRVVILLERVIAGSGGYFETIHNYPKDRAPDGNAREMIFISAESVINGTARTFIAHEFQHLISFNQRELILRAPDDVWLNEARSEYTITVVGYSFPFEGGTLQRRMQTFLRSPSDSLTDWPNATSDYAISSMFVHYLADIYGAEAVTSTIHTAVSGIAAVDEWLSAHTAKRFSDIFGDWMVAVYLNEKVPDPAYGYTQQGLSSIHVQPTMNGFVSPQNIQAAFATSLKEWQPAWISTDMTIGSTTESVANVQILSSTDSQWYGAFIAKYRNGISHVIKFTSARGVADTAVPIRSDGSELMNISVVLTQGLLGSVQNRVIQERTATVTVALGPIVESSVPAQTPVPVAGDTRFSPVADGDLIRRLGQDEVYVVWGPYRRYLTKEILALYGFQNRHVREVSDGLFFRYSASVYIRAQSAKQVFAVWPDGTKHWFNITAAQWDASGRDWGAIFTVNDAEAAAYTIGAEITR